MGHYFDELVQTIKALRDPTSGCPWDLAQDHHSLTPYLIEESYELLNSLLKSDFEETKEELGDVLLQILLHSQLANEKKKFSIEEVCKNLNEKMIRRHPHVFEGNNNLSMDELHENWEKIKKAEGKTDHSLLKKKYLNNPSLVAAYKIGKKTNELKFDWTSIEEVITQLESEIKELKEAIASKSDEIEEEMGDVLFSAAQVARHLGYNPEINLNKANYKFYRRFSRMDELSDKEFLDLNMSEKELLWKRVKNEERK